MDKEWNSLIYQMCKGDAAQMEVTEGWSEEKFYHTLQDHEKRVEFESKYPRVPFF